MNERLEVQTKQRFASEVFWHFVGYDKSENEQFNILLSILKDGLKRKGDKIEFKHVDIKSKKQITSWGYSVICLADIPFKDLHIHAERYGHFAIGFHKNSVIQNKFNPVLYINQYSDYFHKYMEIREEVSAYLDKTDKDIANKYQNFLLFLGSIVKSGDIKANPIVNKELDKFQLNNFYYEREWRSVDNWRFKKEDIAAIIVPDSKMHDFISAMKSNSLVIDEVTPIIPFSMIYRL